jgi:hypothetical protein
METAQDTYKRLHREYLAPAFRELGLRGSKNYVLPDERYWLQIGFQGSDTSTSGAVRFYVNLSVHEKTDWDAFRAESPLMRPAARPAPNVHWPVGKIERHESAAAGPYNRWEVRAGQPLADLAIDVVAAVRDTAIPWLRAHAREATT